MALEAAAGKLNQQLQVDRALVGEAVADGIRLSQGTMFVVPDLSDAQRSDLLKEVAVVDLGPESPTEEQAYANLRRVDIAGRIVIMRRQEWALRRASFVSRAGTRRAVEGTWGWAQAVEAGIG